MSNWTSGNMIKIGAKLPIGLEVVHGLMPISLLSVWAIIHYYKHNLTMSIGVPMAPATPTLVGPTLLKSTALYTVSWLPSLGYKIDNYWLHVNNGNVTWSIPMVLLLFLYKTY